MQFPHQHEYLFRRETKLRAYPQITPRPPPVIPVGLQGSREEHIRSDL